MKIFKWATRDYHILLDDGRPLIKGNKVVKFTTSTEAKKYIRIEKHRMKKNKSGYREDVKLLSIPYTIEIINSFDWLLGPDKDEKMKSGQTFISCKAEPASEKGKECVIIFKANKLGFFYNDEINTLKNNTRIVGKSIVWETIVDDFADTTFKLIK